ncbi:UNVERIFIED_CONTAM: hypothetical protein NCL1_01253 [Trichonephila clavipes]
MTVHGGDSCVARSVHGRPRRHHRIRPRHASRQFRRRRAAAGHFRLAAEQADQPPGTAAGHAPAAPHHALAVADRGREHLQRARAAHRRGAGGVTRGGDPPAERTRRPPARGRAALGLPERDRAGAAGAAAALSGAGHRAGGQRPPGGPRRRRLRPGHPRHARAAAGRGRAAAGAHPLPALRQPGLPGARRHAGQPGGALRPRPARLSAQPRHFGLALPHIRGERTAAAPARRGQSGWGLAADGAATCRHRVAAADIDHEQQHDGADGRRHQAAGGDADRLEQEAADHGAEDADDDIADQPEAAAFHDQAGQPAGDGAYQQKPDHTHGCRSLWLSTPKVAFPAPAGPTPCVRRRPVAAT